MLEDIPDHFKTQKIFERAVCLVPSFLQSIPDHLKTQEICDDAVCRDLFFLQFIPDYFVTQQQLKIWHDYNVYYYDDKLIEWYNGYKKKKGPKSLNKRRVNAYCLAPIKMVGLVYVKRGKKRDRKIVGIGMELFFSP